MLTVSIWCGSSSVLFVCWFKWNRTIQQMINEFQKKLNGSKSKEILDDFSWPSTAFIYCTRNDIPKIFFFYFPLQASLICACLWMYELPRVCFVVWLTSTVCTHAQSLSHRAHRHIANVADRVKLKGTAAAAVAAATTKTNETSPK